VSNTIKTIAIGLIFLFSVQTVWAFDQETQPLSKSDKGEVDTRYIIDPETGQLSMYIRVWGEVNAAGVQIVPSDTDLIALLGFFGGPTNYAKLNNVRIIRYQAKPGEPRVVIANIEKFLDTGDASLIPVIYPNDTIVIKASFWKAFREITPYITLSIQAAQLFWWITRP